MAADTPIRSKQNALVKRFGAVRAGREPESLVIEGDRLVDDALAAGIALDVVLVSEHRRDRATSLERSGCRVQLVDDAVMEHVSGLKSAPGSVALCAVPASVELAHLAIDAHTSILVVAGVADPVNLGALARSAEAFGARALLVARGSASPWNERALRGSMGSLLRLPVGFGLDPGDIARTLTARGVRHVVAATRGGADARTFAWRPPLALWISGETGVLPIEAEELDKVSIPMASSTESLNVAVAGSILLFASSAGRLESSVQRGASSPDQRGARPIPRTSEER